ncbi:polymorphic toxin-type HINT domain-containing protein [Micromonospora sp. NPDC018662]|uniref:polymorphic toxin-type HINT domain-containing protein n=1 Tax=Micromonospora sp. NPDC018662 TaxID=3364238 RepID=UPI0037A03380
MRGTLRSVSSWRRLTAVGAALVLVATLLTVPTSASAAVSAAASEADRELVVQAWQFGGPAVREAAENALLGSDADIAAFLSTGWAQRSKVDERVRVNRMMAGGGFAIQGAAQAALDSPDAGALSAFLESGWQLPANQDKRVHVNRMMAAGGAQVKAAAQKALDAAALEDPRSTNPGALDAFIETGWRTPYTTDLRIRVNQILSAARTNGSATVQTAAQRALDIGTIDALTEFIDSGWAVASTRDQEISTLKDLVAVAEEAQKRTEQQTQIATDESAKAVTAAAAAKRDAEIAASAMASAQGNARQAAAAAQQAANAADNAAKAARQAVAASQAAIAAARVAANAATRAASAAALTRKAATEAHRAAALAVTDGSKMSEALSTAKRARDAAVQARKAAAASAEAERIANLIKNAAGSVQGAIDQAKLAVGKAKEALRQAKETGVNTQQAIVAAERAEASAARSSRAAAASYSFANEAIAAAARSRNAANRAAADADLAADAAEEAAAHAGDATMAAQLSTKAANAATAAANEAVAAANEAKKVYDAARTADAERLAAAYDDGLAAAQAAKSDMTRLQQEAAWDAQEAASRSAEVNRLIAEVTNPATERATAVVSARKVALALTASNGPWTQIAAVKALGGTDDAVLRFVRTGIAVAAAEDDRATALSIGAEGSEGLRQAAEAAVNGSDAEVAAFLQNQDYPGRQTDDRIAVNQILSQAREAGRTVTQQKAQAALDAGTGPALRDFLRTGQYAAANSDDRVDANRIVAATADGTELKAAAQIALDGPATALRQFLATGQYQAARNDHDTAAHNAEASALLSQAAAAATRAVQQAEEAQAVAATARNAAAEAQTWANRAKASATAAAGFANDALASANAAQASADKAAAAASAAQKAAKSANDAAKRAAHSAVWAQDSYEVAKSYATEAVRDAERARQAALAAGRDYDTAQRYYDEAYNAYVEKARAEAAIARFNAVQRCQASNFPGSDDYKDCMHYVTQSDDERLHESLSNSYYCDRFPPEYRKKCMREAPSVNFGTQIGLDGALALTLFTQAIVELALAAEVIGVTMILCNVVCGAFLSVAGGAEASMGIGGAFDMWVTGSLAELAAGGFTGARAFSGLKGLLGLRMPAIAERLIVRTQADDAMLGRLAAMGRSCRVPGASFPAGTRVLTADGATRPIEDLRAGDTVVTTDPYADVTESRRVGAAVSRDGLKKLVELTVDTDGVGGEATGRVTATADHPFWVPDLGRWVHAGDLRAGQMLRTSAGTWVQVLKATRHTERTTVYDLSVASLRTFYVMAGSTPVLVHNEEPCDVALGIRRALGGNLENFARERGLSHFANLSAATWTGPVQAAISNPAIKLHVNLYRFDGKTPQEQFILAVKKALAEGDKAPGTCREMRWIAEEVIPGHRRWDTIVFYDQSGRRLSGAEMPEPDWDNSGLKPAWLERLRDPID